MKIAVLHENLKYVAGLVCEEAVIRHHHGGASAGLQNGQHMLEEVQLLVRGFDREVVAIGHLVRTLSSRTADW